jgi:hypothetical protein
MEFTREELQNMPNKIKEDKIKMFANDLIKNNIGYIQQKASNGEKSYFILIDKRIQDKLDSNDIKIKYIVKEIAVYFKDCTVKFEKDKLIEIKMGSRLMSEKMNGILIDWS